MIPKYMFMNEVSRQLDMTPSEIVCKSRKLKFRNARLILWAALREAGYSFPAIGDYTGRDHSTVNKLLQTCEPIYRAKGKEIYDRVAECGPSVNSPAITGRLSGMIDCACNYGSSVESSYNQSISELDRCTAELQKAQIKLANTPCVWECR